MSDGGAWVSRFRSVVDCYGMMLVRFCAVVLLWDDVGMLLVR
jgi:hypothetical protein